jgi:hypothetical protein
VGRNGRGVVQGGGGAFYMQTLTMLFTYAPMQVFTYKRLQAFYIRTDTVRWSSLSAREGEGVGKNRGWVKGGKEGIKYLSIGLFVND